MVNLSIFHFLQINNKKTVVCSRHFKKDDYKWSAGPLNGKRLKPNAVPTVFTWVGPDETTSRPNPLDRVRESVRQEFHESDISDDEPMDTVLTPLVLPELSSNSSMSPNALANLQEQLQKQVEEIQKLKEEKAEAEKKIETLEKENNFLKYLNEIERFGVERFGTDDHLFKFYTGFTSIGAFKVFFTFIQPAANNMQRIYYQAAENVNAKVGRPSCMKLVDELFLFCTRIRLGLFEEDLADRFHCSVSTVSKKVTTWANFLYFVLGSWNIWLSKGVIQERMPQSFKEKYGDTRVIIDCTEIRTQIPKSLVLNSQLYSHYKGANTFKGLIGIAPHGLVTFVSALYTGCMSDVEITKLCGIIDLLEEGDSVMADKGFTIEKLLKEKNVSLNIPPFLSSNTQFTPTQVAQTQEIAKVRIHVERSIARIKQYHIFSSPIPLTLAGSINQIWTVAALLTNFQGPLINEQ